MADCVAKVLKTPGDKFLASVAKSSNGFCRRSIRNAEHDSLFRLANQLEEVHSIAESTGRNRATQSLAMNK
jgi:hypothetical protein